VGGGREDDADQVAGVDLVPAENGADELGGTVDDRVTVVRLDLGGATDRPNGHGRLPVLCPARGVAALVSGHLTDAATCRIGGESRNRCVAMWLGRLSYKSTHA